MRESRRLRGNLTRAAAASALLLGTIGLSAQPAQALGECSITGQNASATIGVPQQLTVVDCTGTNTVVVNAGGVTQSLPIYPGPGSSGLATWTPSVLGATTLTLGTVSVAAFVSQVATTTIITAPNVVQVGVGTKITVTVQSTSPSTYPPTGTVLVKDANGATVANMGLTAGPGNGQAYAYWTWTPATAGNYLLQATYSGDTNAKGSVSAQDAIFASPSGNTIALALPPTMTVGVPATLTATFYPASIQGSTGFTVNGNPISASVPIVNGVSTFVWTPTVPGQTVIGANYTTNSGATGSTSDPITISNSAAQTDVITLTQPGFGTWAPNGTYTVSNGTTINFTASTLSGAAVTLSETGPCQVSGLTLVVDASNATCNVTASSPGGNGYAPAKYGYTVTTGLGQQTAILAAPQSGRVNVGKVLTMETPQQGDTNAGQNIVWRITKGKNKICKLGFPSSGAVTLKVIKRGQCSVRGDAPGVANVWAPYVVVRTYQGK